MKCSFFYKLALIFLFIQPYSFLVYPQKNDLGMWINADLDIAWNNKWQSVFTAELRAKDDISQIDLYSLGSFTNYNWTKFFRLGFGYELFANNVKNHRIKWEHRMMIQSNIQHSVGRIKIGWRSSYMDTFYSFSDPNFGMRNRLKVDYSLPKNQIKPFVSTELYHKFDHGIGHQKNRYTGGIHYKFKAKQQLDFYYMIEDYSTKTFTRHVIGIGYSYTFL